MKTKEELTVLKEEYETMSKKLAELTEDELAEVTGGAVQNTYYLPVSKFDGFAPPDTDETSGTGA